MRVQAAAGGDQERAAGDAGHLTPPSAASCTTTSSPARAPSSSSPAPEPRPAGGRRPAPHRRLSRVPPGGNVIAARPGGSLIAWRRVRGPVAGRVLGRLGRTPRRVAVAPPSRRRPPCCPPPPPSRRRRSRCGLRPAAGPGELVGDRPRVVGRARHPVPGPGRSPHFTSEAAPAT